MMACAIATAWLRSVGVCGAPSPSVPIRGTGGPIRPHLSEKNSPKAQSLVSPQYQSLPEPEDQPKPRPQPQPASLSLNTTQPLSLGTMQRIETHLSGFAMDDTHVLLMGIKVLFLLCMAGGCFQCPKFCTHAPLSSPNCQMQCLGQTPHLWDCKHGAHHCLRRRDCCCH